MTASPTAFAILRRAFLEQFVANESVTSDIQMRRAIIGVITFLITPGLFVIMKVGANPAQMAVLFVSYSMVTTGLLTVFIWDTLVFDKRDSMVLGPLPLRGTTIVAAKLAALATFIMGAALAVNVTSALPFAFVTGGPEGHLLRHLAGHLSGTIGGAVFVFSTLVIVRGLLVFVSPQIATTVGSSLQFAFLSAVLCFMMVPTAMGESSVPIAWFFGLFEAIRGSRHEGVDVLAQRGLIALALSVTGAIAVTFGGYWRQMRAALAPAARVGASARLRRRVARLITGRDQSARGTSDFILIALARSRPQQVPIAIAASIGVAIASVAVATRPGGFAELQVPRTVVLWIPMVIGYWIIVGLRSSFYVPTELAAAWSFRVHSSLPSVSYWSAVRASMIAFAVPPSLLTNLLIVLPLLGWRIAAWHALFVCIAVAMAAQAASITIDSVPFTRAYPPGRTKLKTRWPLYLGGMYAVAYWPVRWELAALESPIALMKLALAGIAGIIVLELVGRRAALEWQLQPDVEYGDDPEAPTVLNLGQVEPRALYAAHHPRV